MVTVLDGGYCNGETWAEEAQRRSPGPSQQEGLRMKRCSCLNAQGGLGFLTRRRRRMDARQRKEHWQGRTESWEVTLIEVTILAFRKIL